MASLDDFVRSFGMSGFLITDELRKIEEQYSIELGHLPKPRASSVEYYPQFEQAVRTEAAEASEHYEVIYCLEQSIRKLISETLEDAAGADWWNSGKVPQEVQQEVNRRLKAEKESGMTQRSTELIDYTTFGELSVIISANWDLFTTVLTDQRAMSRVMTSLNLLRNPVAHCTPMADDEVERLRLSVKDWFRLMG